MTQRKEGTAFDWMLVAMDLLYRQVGNARELVAVIEGQRKPALARIALDVSAENLRHLDASVLRTGADIR